MVNFVEFYALGFQLSLNLVVGIVGNLQHFGAALFELFDNDLTVCFRNAVQHFSVDVNTAGTQQMTSKSYVLNVLIAFGTDIGEFGAFQAVNNLLRNCRQGFGPGQSSSGSAHVVDGININLGFRSTQLHTF